MDNSESFVQHPRRARGRKTTREKSLGKILVSCGVEILRDPLASKDKSGKLWEGRDIRDFHHILHPRAGGG